MTMAKVIAITGASAGIGRAVALRLARDGAKIGICARRRERLEVVAGEIEREGGEALPVVADVSSETDVAQFVRRTVERFGRLDVMLANAGFGIYGALDAMAPAQIRELFEVNVMGTFNAARSAMHVFRDQGEGHLIVVSSIVGQRGIPYMGAYSATKFAQVGLAESLRAEVEGSAIHVSVVFPVSTRTEFHDVMQRLSGLVTRAPGPRQSADVVAEAVARAVARPRPEVYPYGPARGLNVLNALAPGLCDRLVKRWGRKPVHD